MVELDGTVEGRLSAHGNDDAVRLFFLDDFFDKLGCHRKEKDMVRHAR